MRAHHIVSPADETREITLKNNKTTSQLLTVGRATTSLHRGDHNMYINRDDITTTLQPNTIIVKCDARQQCHSTTQLHAHQL